MSKIGRVTCERSEQLLIILYLIDLQDIGEWSELGSTSNTRMITFTRKSTETHRKRFVDFETQYMNAI